MAAHSFGEGHGVDQLPNLPDPDTVVMVVFPLMMVVMVVVVFPLVVMVMLPALLLAVDGNADVQALHAAFRVRLGADEGLSREGGVDLFQKFCLLLRVQ